MSRTNNFYDAGVREYTSGNLDAALELFRKHTRVQPSDHRGFIAVGVILEGKGFVEQAVESFSVAVRLKGDAESHLNLGKTLQKLRRKGRAADEEREYRAALALDTRCGEAWCNLADLQHWRGDYDSAAASALESLRIEPENPRYHHKLGLAYFFSGQDALADRSFQKSNGLAIKKWGSQLDGDTAASHRRWFAVPQRPAELLRHQSGTVYGQRVPRTSGPCSWQLPSLLYRQQRSYLVQLRDVYMEGLHGLVYNDDSMFAAEPVKIQGVWRFFVEATPKHPRSTTTLEKVASTHQPDCTNYYHWTVDCLTRLLLLKPTLDRDPEIKLLTPRQGLSYIDESLDLLGVPEARRIKNQASPKHRYLARQLFYIDWQWPLSETPSAELAATWYPPREGLRQLREQLAGPSAPDVDRRRIIYIRRTAEQTRHVKHDEGLIETLRGKFGEDFVVFTGEKQSVRTQIELFRTASVVFGPHGAGFTNILYCAPGTRVAEFPIVPAVLNHFAHLAMALDLEYWVTPDLWTNYLGNYEMSEETQVGVVALVERLVRPS